MPRNIRYFPVTHDINTDPELWELTDRFGDRALRVWLEILSIADRNYGKLDGDFDGWVGVLMRVYSTSNPRWIKRDRDNLFNCLKWMLERGWIRLRERSEGDQKRIRRRSEGDQKALGSLSEAVLEVTNYAKYHKTRGENSAPPNLTYPNLSYPNHKEEDNKHRNRKSVAPLVPWPPEDLWLKNLIEQQPFFSHALQPLSDFGWWEDVSTAINGIDPRFIEPEFAKMSAWLRENPGRKPTAKGCRRFVRTWLERARENQRRLYAVKK